MPKVTTPEYVRVYQSVVDDEKFVTIYDDDHHFATWVRLLMAADAMWPASCPIPANARKASLRALCEAGIVDVQGSRFRIRGLDKEREQRSESARNAAALRWHTERIPTPNADPMPSRAEPSKAEPSRAEQPREDRDDGRADLEAFLLLTRRTPTPRQRKLLDGLLDRHDLTGPKWAADIMMRHPDDPIGAVIAADREWRAERIAEAQAAEKPKPVPRRKPGLPVAARELLAEWNKEVRNGAVVDTSREKAS